MGTSNKYGGPKSNNPLIPSWLNDPDTSDNSDQEPLQPENPVIPVIPIRRFAPFRTNFNKYTRSGDRNSLRKALSNYVARTSGGSKTASQRMASSKVAAGNILSFINDVKHSGVDNALSKLGLNDLIGKDPQEAFSALTEVFCPPGGPVDDSIVRSAWDDAMINMLETGIDNITALTNEQWGILFKDFIALSIKERIYNDLGQNSINLPQDIQKINQTDIAMYQLIRGAVDDAIGTRLENDNLLTQSDLQTVVDEIYQSAYAFLEVMEEE